MAAPAAGWGVDRLAHVVVPAASGSAWGEYRLCAAWTSAALATFVALTRLAAPRH